MAYYLGLDNGGTSTKAAIFDAFGHELCVASTAANTIVSGPGFTERDMEEMWQANCRVVRDALERSGISPEEIACVACCGHGKGLYLWGKDNRPVRYGIVSTDNRAWQYPLEWERRGVASQVFQRSCQQVLASQPVALLAWLKDHEPEAIQRTRWIFSCKDYIRFCLTDVAYGELTDYSGNNFVNLYTKQYDPELLRLFGLSECLDKLPPLCSSTQLCGTVTPAAAACTGLRAGTPVAGGAFDIDACALAVNVTSEANICMIAGTWSINEYIRPKPVLDGTVMMNSLFCIPEYYLIEECSPTSAGNNEWFIQTLLPELALQKKNRHESIYQQMNDWVDAFPPEEFCPIFLPFLMASNVHPNAHAAFLGLSSYHTRAHLAKSIYEGITFSHRYHLEKLLANRIFPPQSIRLAGGVVHSAVWRQMFADVTGLPVEVVDAQESGALGCAIIGAAATGAYSSLSEAATHMCRISPPILPNPNNQAVYEKKYHLYLEAIESLDSLWDKMERCKESL